MEGAGSLFLEGKNATASHHIMLPRGKGYIQLECLSKIGYEGLDEVRTIPSKSQRARAPHDFITKWGIFEGIS